MSTTATETRTLISLLGDYELHHSVASEETPGPSPMASPPPSSQPASWPTHHRRVPPYRPINYNLDLNDRPTGSNPVESVLIFLMMHGVWLNACTAQLWRKTGGRLNDRIFRYKVGGEW